MPRERGHYSEKYSKDDLRAAVGSVLKVRWSTYKASKKYNLPFNNLKRFQYASSGPDDVVIPKKGRPVALTVEEDQKLVTYRCSLPMHTIHSSIPGLGKTRNLSSVYGTGYRAVASWSEASCLGVALRNARWFESSWGKKFSHDISASVWDRCPPSIVMHLGSYDRFYQSSRYLGSGSSWLRSAEAERLINICTTHWQMFKERKQIKQEKNKEIDERGQQEEFDYNSMTVNEEKKDTKDNIKKKKDSTVV
ncbi:hypothetical protein ANN_07853 [Periplaneta americana]|uniref:Uncharacterized protein n=1 Tax=Periplaneta americana TaxID=6978 RepID=A0ABQ8T206_PERAM|nr:hypothetical protein ANN_07853 [Periplaneta americana]